MHSGGRTPPLQNMVYVDAFRATTRDAPTEKHTSYIKHHKSYIKHHNYEQHLGKNLENRNHRINRHRDHLRPAGMHLTHNS